MEHPNTDLIDLIPAPCFCVREGRITACNQAARGLLLPVGSPVAPMLATGAEEYAAFQGGSLFLTLNIGGTGFGADVERRNGADYFLLEQEGWDRELTSLALAARDLRNDLSGLSVTAEALSQKGAEEAPQLNRSLARLLRTVGNMSAAASQDFHPELLDICALCREIFQKAADQLEAVPRSLRYQVPESPIYTLADPQMIERAILNLLSNAAKFTSSDDLISCSLTRVGRMLSLTVQDTGTGIPQELRGSLFHRYLRQPAIEDGRHGIGLGLVLVRSAAAHHGGTVLIDSPGPTGTRVTVTLEIRQDIPQGLRSPFLRVDYSSERDHGLVALSDVLPLECYRVF